MARRSDPVRLHTAKLNGSAAAVRDQVLTADPAAVAEQRAALPRLWEAIDQLCDLVGTS